MVLVKGGGDVLFVYICRNFVIIKRGKCQGLLFGENFLFLCEKSRYVSLYFCMCVDMEDNELEVFEIIQYFVEILDCYFGSVSLKWYSI